jgi:hypothetical protein
MPLPGFDTLRAKHPSDIAAIAQLESYIETTLRSDAHAIINDALVEQYGDADGKTLRQFLVELVERGALDTRFFWICPVDGGTSIEASEVTEFPDEIECSRCGQRHKFSQRDIEVHFVPTDMVKRMFLSR